MTPSAKPPEGKEERKGLALNARRSSLSEDIVSDFYKVVSKLDDNVFR